MADMRIVDTIKYGSASAVRVDLSTDICWNLKGRYIAFDTETTGLDPEKDRIVELGAVVFENGVPTVSFQSFVNPCISIPEEASAINHITNEMLQDAPRKEDIYPKLMEFLGDAVVGKAILCGHVAAFDLSFLCRTLNQLGIEASFRFVDTRELATRIPELEHHSLAAVAGYFAVPHENAHHAKEDALTSGRILQKMLDEPARKGIING